MWEILANPQTPALTVLVVLVFAFLGFLRFAFKAIQQMVKDNTEATEKMVKDATGIAKHCARVIEENSKIQGQVLERLRAANGHAVEIGDGDRG